MKWLPAVLPALVILAFVPGWHDVAVAKWLVVYLAGLMCVLWLLVHAREWDVKDALVVSVVAWFALSLSWSADWMQGALHLIRAGSIAAVFLYCRRLDDRRSLSYGAGAAVVLSLLMTFVVSGSLGGTWNENVEAEFLSISIPLVHWSIAALAAARLIFSDSHMQWAGLIAVILTIAFVTGARYVVRAPIVAAVAFIAVCVASILLVESADARESVLPRLQLALGTLSMWWDSPLIGQGLGSFDYLWPTFQNADTEAFPGLWFLGMNEPWILPGAAHNEPLQVLAETGLIGFGLLVLAVCIGLKPTPRNFIALVLLGSFALLDFPLQNPETAVLGTLALAQASPLSAKRFSLPSLLQIPAFGAAVAMTFVVWMGVSHARAESAYSKTYALNLVHMASGVNDRSRSFAELAFSAEALNAFPYPTEYRLQLYRSMVNAFLSGTLIDERAENSMWRIAQSASPENPGLLVSRVYFWRASGQCESKCEPELKRIAANNWRLTAMDDITRMVLE